MDDKSFKLILRELDDIKSDVRDLKVSQQSQLEILSKLRTTVAIVTSSITLAVTLTFNFLLDLFKR